jgi:hypothetical protein
MNLDSKAIFFGAAGLVAGTAVASASIALYLNQQKPKDPKEVSRSRPFLECRVKNLPLSSKEATPDEPESHALWTKVLKKYVLSGELRSCNTNCVDFAGVCGDEDFQRYLVQLSEMRDVGTWPMPKQLAFWLNAYNALCMNHVVKYKNARPNDPKLEKLGQIPARMGKSGTIWDEPAGIVAGETYTLDEIEHVIVRGTFNEIRAHGALNCESLGCPNLRAEAYEAHKLNEQLDEQCNEWISNEHKGVAVMGSGSGLRVSNILFPWFDCDFGTRIMVFIEEHGSPKVKEFLRERRGVDVKLYSRAYDWGLIDAAFQDRRPPK